ncbi:putative wall-associated receptor kinase [Helianthus annuus]|nr:putative wall-associated receptor kinase [Helianthus annuus]
MKLFQAYLLLLLFISLTTPPALAKHAKPGCIDMCGNVIIPYPFGIGTGCSINPWYMVDCKNSTPYLSVLKQLEVLQVDLEYQTVTVNTPTMISYCQNPVRNSSHTMSIDLGGSPFWFSKSHNKFVFEGYGVAVMMMDGGSMVTGCSTASLNVSDSDRKKCFGNGCCQTAIPHYLKSYSINITSLEEEEGGCGSAFLVDKTSYDQGRLSDSLIVRRSASFIPISLLWTLTDSDQVTCCNSDDTESSERRERRQVDMFNGNPVYTWRCNSYYERSLNPYLIDGCKKEYANPNYAKPGCKQMCGNIRIPYPFGIGANCSINPWYIIDCNSSKPHLRALNHLEVLGVNLESQILNVSMQKISYCQNTGEIRGLDLRSSPFWFSELHNKFVFEGCACSTTCRSVTHSDRNTCFGSGCCQTPIPNSLKSFSINITGLDGGDGACRSAFLVEDETLYEKAMFSDPLFFKNSSVIPIALKWTLTASDQVTCCYNQPPQRDIMDMINGSTMEAWRCYDQWSSDGNPYLIDGCFGGQGGDHAEECKRCEDSGGYCQRARMYDIDGSEVSQTFTCHHYNKTSLGLILVEI